MEAESLAKVAQVRQELDKKAVEVHEKDLAILKLQHRLDQADHVKQSNVGNMKELGWL